MSWPQGLLMKRTIKNRKTKTPKKTLRNLLKYRNLFFLFFLADTTIFLIYKDITDELLNYLI
jgi:hypothetical protein